jgi:lysophospholipid acyltransferase (LPLAT)-like uncharacterized protein
MKLLSTDIATGSSGASKTIPKRHFFSPKVIGLAGGVVLKLINYSCSRYQVDMPDDLDMYQSLSKPCIFTFWHGQLLYMPVLWNRTLKQLGPSRIFSLSSQHRDGRMVAEAMKSQGIESIAGSSSRGGSRALIHMIKVIEKGYHCAMTPDGPKGPIYNVKLGVIKMAQLTGAPIVPLAATSTSAWVFSKSWDKMRLVKPFSKFIAAVGRPIYVDRDSNQNDLENQARDVATVLNQMTKRVNDHTSTNLNNI